MGKLDKPSEFSEWVWGASRGLHTGVCEQKHFSGEEDVWEDKLSEHLIRGWRAISAAGLQGKGSYKRNVFFTEARMPPREAVTCERAFLAALDGNCKTPIAGQAKIEDRPLPIWGFGYK